MGVLFLEVLSTAEAKQDIIQANVWFYEVKCANQTREEAAGTLGNFSARLILTEAKVRGRAAETVFPAGVPEGSTGGDVLEHASPNFWCIRHTEGKNQAPASS